MAQNLARLFSEVGNHLLLQNEHMETQKTPNEERIPILRQIYLRQMRQIHEMEPDGNSRARYNEREQSLLFYHYSPTGGGGGRRGDEFASKLQSLLKIKESIGDDPAASELTEGLQELKNKWFMDFFSKHIRRNQSYYREGDCPPQPVGVDPSASYHAGAVYG